MKPSYEELVQHIENLRYAGNRVIRIGEGSYIWDLALRNLPGDSPLHNRIEELEEEASEAAAERDALAAHVERLSEAAEPFAEAWRFRAQRLPQTSGNKVREKRDLDAGFYSVMKPDGERYLLTGHDLKRLGEAVEKLRRQAQGANNEVEG